MDLTSYVEAVRRDLAAAAENGGPEVQALAERLVAPLESSLRLALLDVLSAAAAEITRDLAPGSVDLRLRDRVPSFVVTAPPPPPTDAPVGRGSAPGPSEPTETGLPSGPSGPSGPMDADDAAMTRINLRLTEDLKGRVEEGARQSGISVNAWLVRAATGALAGPDRHERDDRDERGGRAPRGGERLIGWVR